MSCWVGGCDGNHDSYTHPRHNCRPPRAANARAGTEWTCGCGKTWRVTPGCRPEQSGWAQIGRVGSRP